MWIVRITLSHPYTFVVLRLLVLIVAPVIILQTPTDIPRKHQEPEPPDPRQFNERR
jgi:hypothetical protein